MYEYTHGNAAQLNDANYPWAKEGMEEQGKKREVAS